MQDNHSQIPGGGAQEQDSVLNTDTDMDGALLAELDELRAENKILRDSLTEIRPGSPDEGEKAMEKILRDIGGMITATTGRAKESLGPGADKITEILSRNLEENPAPILLAAFGAGYLVSRGLERK